MAFLKKGCKRGQGETSSSHVVIRVRPLESFPNAARRRIMYSGPGQKHGNPETAASINFRIPAHAPRARLAGPGREGDPSLPSERCRVRARIEIENTGASYASFIIAGGRRAQCLKNGLYWYHGSASRPRREERREILRAYHSSKLSRAWMS